MASKGGGRRKAGKDGLDSEKEKEIAEMFKLFDKNGDKSISTAELGRAMRGMGFELTNKEVRDAMRQIDVNKSGTIEYGEFRSFMVQRMKAIENQKDDDTHIRQAFKVFDRDGNGYIDTNELQRAMTTLGERLTAEELKLMMRDADLNGDGKIDYEEFVRMWTQQDKAGVK